MHPKKAIFLMAYSVGEKKIELPTKGLVDVQKADLRQGSVFI